MRRFWPAAVALTIIAATAGAQQPTQAGAPAPAASADVQVGTAIENRMLVGAAESFALGTQKLFCFSRISNAAGSEVEHVWYKGDVEMGRVKLAVNGSPWRTHSSKNLGDDASGEWRCEVMRDGKTIQSARFKVE
jgi:hypothetical protein